MNKVLSYSLKVWLTTIVLCPVLSILTLLIQAVNLHEAANVVMLLVGSPFSMLLIGVLTIPSAVLFYISSKYLLKWGVKTFFAKIILSLLGLLLTCLTISVFGNFRFTLNYVFVILPYLISIFISIWIYRLESSK
jgi:hypothetical protein